MAVNRGKQFEDRFEEDWEATFPNPFILRLYDQVTGYKTTSQNPCDYITFEQGKLFMVECKSTNEGTLNFSKIPQYERLLEYKHKRNVYPGILVWFTKFNLVYWYPIEEAEKIRNDGNKSLKPIDIKLYNILNIPSIKLRVFMKSDYTKLVEESNGKDNIE